jgi:hypothetical protein
MDGLPARDIAPVPVGRPECCPPAPNNPPANEKRARAKALTRFKISALTRPSRIYGQNHTGPNITHPRVR